MDQNHEFKDQLRKIREYRKYTQTAAAKELGIPRLAYNRYETGVRKPSIETTKKFAQFFDTSIEFLMGVVPYYNSPSMYSYDEKNEQKNNPHLFADRETLELAEKIMKLPNNKRKALELLFFE